MRHILIATHGLFSSGAKSTMDFLLGDVKNVDCITAYVDEKANLNEQLEEYFSKIPQEDELVIFTDMKGGSVNQKIIPYSSQRKNTYLIAGFNLAILIEVTMTTEKITTALLESMIKNSRDALCLVELEEKKDDSDEDFLQ